MAFQEDFLYPLIILLVGSGISLFLVPMFTRKYQEKQRSLEIERENRHKELDIKTNLISKISEITAKATNYTHSLLTDANFRISGEKYTEWGIEYHTINRLMEVYFENTELIKKWKGFSNALSEFVYIFYILVQTKKQPNLDILKEYLGEESLSWDAFQVGQDFMHEWAQIKESLVYDQVVLIREINSTPIRIL